jgi:hypothetical protein
MKATELIDRLKRLVDTYGDQPLRVNTEDGYAQVQDVALTTDDDYAFYGFQIEVGGR